MCVIVYSKLVYSFIHSFKKLVTTELEPTTFGTAVELSTIQIRGPLVQFWYTLLVHDRAFLFKSRA